MKQISQWRTVGLVVFACLLLALAFSVAVCRASPRGAPLVLADVARLFDAMTDAVVWLVAAAAFKSLGEHLGRGRGLKGARDALLTDAQPAEAPTAGAQP